MFFRLPVWKEATGLDAGLLIVAGEGGSNQELLVKEAVGVAVRLEEHIIMHALGYVKCYNVQLCLTLVFYYQKHKCHFWNRMK